jgi:hypothetical protein
LSFIVATWELSTSVVTLVSCTFSATATGIERKQLLNYRSGNVYPLLFKANFSGYRTPPDHPIFCKDDVSSIFLFGFNLLKSHMVI